MKKERYYKLKYWFSSTKITTESAFKNYNEAYQSLYKNNLKIISVKFIGWK